MEKEEEERRKKKSLFEREILLNLSNIVDFSTKWIFEFQIFW